MSHNPKISLLSRLSHALVDGIFGIQAERVDEVLHGELQRGLELVAVDRADGDRGFAAADGCHQTVGSDRSHLLIVRRPVDVGGGDEVGQNNGMQLQRLTFCEGRIITISSDAEFPEVPPYAIVVKLFVTGHKAHAHQGYHYYT